MLIGGFQKMTMLDFPGRVACTIFTGGCNFRCPFCHNALLVTDFSKEDCLDEKEILDTLLKRRNLLDGVAITGGEPTLQPDLIDFMHRIKEIGYEIKLDTNGSRPDIVERILKEKLVSYFAMDIKNCDEKYAQTIGFSYYDLSAVYETRRLLEKSGIPFEYRTTVMQELHTTEDIIAIVKTIPQGTPYFIQKFVDSGELIKGGFHEVPREEMLHMRDEAIRILPTASLRGVE